MGIKIRLAEKYRERISEPKVKNQIEEVQAYVDRSLPILKENCIHFVPLYARYYECDKNTEFVCVCISKIDNDICRLCGKMDTAIKGEPAIHMDTMDFDFPEEFLGILHKDEGITMQFDIPTEGINEDRIFKTHELLCELREVNAFFLKKGKTS